MSLKEYDILDELADEMAENQHWFVCQSNVRTLRGIRYLISHNVTEQDLYRDLLRYVGLLPRLEKGKCYWRAEGERLGELDWRQQPASYLGTYLGIKKEHKHHPPQHFTPHSPDGLFYVFKFSLRDVVFTEKTLFYESPCRTTKEFMLRRTPGPGVVETYAAEYPPILYEIFGTEQYDVSDKKLRAAKWKAFAQRMGLYDDSFAPDLLQVPILRNAPNVGTIYLGEEATNGFNLDVISSGEDVYAVSGPLPDGSRFRHVYRCGNLENYFDVSAEQLKNPNNNEYIGTRTQLKEGFLIEKGKVGYKTSSVPKPRRRRSTRRMSKRR